MSNGIINVYKEKGYTSFDVVAVLRGICSQKKAGHTGTLDPDAEGVLPVCLGNATRVSGMLDDRDKTYRAVMLLGLDTDTYDMTGTVVNEGSTEGISDETVNEVIAGFVGDIDQIPPMYSALKVNGQKLCDLARKGETIERKPRKITIFEINVEKIVLPRVTMTIRCSRGTYIRSLCHDIGERLGCYGTMESLVRIADAGFLIEDALRLGEIQQLKDAGRLAECIRPVEDVFKDYPRIKVHNMADRLIHNGNPVPESLMETYVSDSCKSAADTADNGADETYVSGPVRVRMADSTGEFCGIYEFDGRRKCFVPVKMFLNDRC